MRTLTVPLVPVVATEFAFTYSGANPLGWIQSATTAPRMLFAVGAVPDYYVRGVEVWVSGDPAQSGSGIHTAGGLPATKPVVTLWRRLATAFSTGPVAAATMTDPSATPSAYDQVHVIRATIADSSSQASTGRDYVWSVQIDGEKGANSLGTSLTVYAAILLLSPHPTEPIV